MYAPDEETYVGRITKQWSGIGKELFTDADNFGVSFPVDLDVSMKAVVLGCVFLIVSFFRSFFKFDTCDMQFTIEIDLLIKSYNVISS